MRDPSVSAVISLSHFRNITSGLILPLLRAAAAAAGATAAAARKYGITML